MQSPDVTPSFQKKLAALPPGPIDPVWIRKLYRSASPPTAAAAAALAAAANRRNQSAAAEKDVRHDALASGISAVS